MYAYIYGGYPEDKERKYYVGDYRSGNAYTYQVVPQLQRDFDRRGYENKTELEPERFEDLRRRGHLYTENRSHEREPLYGAIDWEAIPERWRAFARWIGGEEWPGSVDWRELGAELRRRLQEADPLPGELARRAEPLVTDVGASVPQLYERIRRRHVDRCWFHLREHRSVEQIAGAESRTLAAELSGDRPASDVPLDDLLRETRVPAEAPDEGEWRRAMAEALGTGDVQWSDLSELVGPEEEWYREVEVEPGTAMRVPAEALYDLQWVLARKFEALGLHHESAPEQECDAPAVLHARFHAGARRAAIVELAGYPRAISGERLRSELAVEARSGLFEGWSETALDALVQIAVDPETGRLGAAAPSSESAAECALWNFDASVRRRVETGWGAGAEWRYSRLGDELVISTPDDVPARTLSEVVAAVSELLDDWRLGVESGGVTLWGGGNAPLEAGGLQVPSRRGAPVEFDPERTERLGRIATRAREGEVGEAERAELRRAYRVTADLRYAALGDATVRADVRALLLAVGMREFSDALVDGWFGDVGAAEGATGG